MNQLYYVHMQERLQEIAESPRRLAALLLATFLFGMVWFVLVRAITLDIESTHYHANFALFIDGAREEFEEGTFYEEVSSCGSSEDDPLARVHMHDMVNHIVHVHDGSSTWGNFFENIGFTLGDTVLKARAQTYVDGKDGELSFILNGQEVRTIAAKPIKSEDVLLISFNNAKDADLQQQYDSIKKDAAEYNERADPSACSGNETLSFVDKIKYVIGIN